MNVTSLKDYSRAVLDLYARLPGTPTKPVPLTAAGPTLFPWHHPSIEAALFLASARRICRNPAKPPLPQVRSLAYFLPVIEELSQSPLPTGYLAYVRSKVILNRVLTRAAGDAS